MYTVLYCTIYQRKGTKEIHFILYTLGWSLIGLYQKKFDGRCSLPCAELLCPGAAHGHW
jgi:hypothetical protein